MNVLLAASAALGVLLLYDGLTDRSPRRGGDLFAALDVRLAEAGLNSSGGRVVAGSIAAWVLVFVVITGVTSSPIVGSVLAVGGAAAPGAYISTRRKKRLRRLREDWPDALASLIAGVRAGMSLPEACAPGRPLTELASRRVHGVRGYLQGERQLRGFPCPTPERVLGSDGRSRCSLSVTRCSSGGNGSCSSPQSIERFRPGRPKGAQGGRSALVVDGYRSAGRSRCSMAGASHDGLAPGGGIDLQHAIRCNGHLRGSDRYFRWLSTDAPRGEAPR